MFTCSSTVPASAERGSPHAGQGHLWRPAGVLPLRVQSGNPHEGHGGCGRQRSAASESPPTPIGSRQRLSAMADLSESNSRASRAETVPA